MNKKQTSLLLALAAIATTNKEGYTVNAATLQPVKTGYAVAVADTQDWQTLLNTFPNILKSTPSAVGTTATTTCIILMLP